MILSLLVGLSAHAAIPDCLEGLSETADWPLEPQLEVLDAELRLTLNPTEDTRWERCDLDVSLRLGGYAGSDGVSTGLPVVGHGVIASEAYDAGEGLEYTLTLWPESFHDKGEIDLSELIGERDLTLPDNYLGMITLAVTADCVNEEEAETRTTLESGWLACTPDGCALVEESAFTDGGLAQDTVFDYQTMGYVDARVTPMRSASLDDGMERAKAAWTRRLHMNALAAGEALADDPSTLRETVEIDPVYQSIFEERYSEGLEYADTSWNSAPETSGEPPLEGLSYPEDALPAESEGSPLGHTSAAKRPTFDATLIPQNGTEDSP